MLGRANLRSRGMDTNTSEFGLVRRGEMGSLLRLMNEVHDLADEPRLWKTHFLATVGRLVGATVGVFALVHDVSEGKAWRYASVVETGWVGERQRDVAREWLAGEGARDPMEAIAAKAGARVTAARREVVPDEAWYGSPHVRDVRRQAGIDDCVYSLYHLPEPGWAACVSLHRPWGDRRRFGGRERALVHLAHSGLEHHYEREARIAEIVGSGGRRRHMTPRMRQTLDLLLAGLSEKEAARKLKLSPNTLHVHVRSLYRRYDVNSRAELMAKLLPHAGRATLS